MLRVYLAGAISGISYEEATGWRNKVQLAFERWRTHKPPVCIIDPMRQKSYLSEESCIASVYPGTTTSSSRAIYQRDRFDVQRCDVLLVNLSVNSGRNSVGTLVEIGMADAWGKLILIVSDQEVCHPFLTENSIVFPTLEDAIEFIKGL